LTSAALASYSLHPLHKVIKGVSSNKTLNVQGRAPTPLQQDTMALTPCAGTSPYTASSMTLGQADIPTQQSSNLRVISQDTFSAKGIFSLHCSKSA